MIGKPKTDLTGQRFGKLVALKYMPGGNWQCICDCGNEKIIGGGDLKRKIKGTRSCGCLRNGKDLTGQKFGKLTPVEHLGYGVWRCVCDCGNSYEINSGCLTASRVKSCGCAYYEDLTDQKFGKLTPVEYLGGKRWRCLCDCGNPHEATAANLKKGSPRSCGCMIMTKGERAIKQALKNFGIDDFIYQMSFDTCRNILPLPFDFYLPEYKLLIEYQGETHFEPIYGDEPLIRTRLNDTKKADWAISNGRTLLAINYWDCERIQQILADTLKGFTPIEYCKQLDLL